MDKRTLVEKLKALAASPSCHPDLKQAVNNYFVALAAEQVAAKNLLAELEEDVVDIDTLVKNVGDTEHMVKFFGVEGAKLFAETLTSSKHRARNIATARPAQSGLKFSTIATFCCPEVWRSS